MKLYIAHHEDGTISILSAKSKKDLKERLLNEDRCLPYSVREYTFAKEEHIHLTTKLLEMEGGGTAICVDYCSDKIDWDNPDAKNIETKKIEL